MPMLIGIDIAKRAKGDKGKGEKPYSEAAEGEDSGGFDEVKASAVADMWAAMQDKDEESFGSALADYVEACIEKHKSEPPPEEE